MQDLDNNKLEKQTHIDSVKSIWESVRGCEVNQNEHYNHTLTLENYCEKYAPMHTMTQISEVLHFTLDKKYRKKLNQYEKTKYLELHQVILEDEGNPFLMKYMDKMVEKIVNDIKENASYYKSKHVKMQASKHTIQGSSKVVSHDPSRFQSENMSSAALNKLISGDPSSQNIENEEEAYEEMSQHQHSIHQNIFDENGNVADLDESISLTERLDGMKDNVYKEVDQVKFRLKEVSDNVDSLTTKLEELTKHFTEENKARIAEIFNIISEVQESKTEKMSIHAQSQMGRINSIIKDLPFGVQKRSNDTQILNDDLRMHKSRPKLSDTANFARTDLQATARNTSDKLKWDEKSKSSVNDTSMFIRSFEVDSVKNNPKEMATRLKLNYLREKGRNRNKLHQSNNDVAESVALKAYEAVSTSRNYSIESTKTLKQTLPNIKVVGYNK